MGLLTIKLNNLRFFAFHGLYDSEKQNGGYFTIHISLSYHPQQEIIQSIEETIDYAAIYAILKQRMTVATELLETWVMETAKIIGGKYTLIESIDIELIKEKPPIEDFEGSSSVVYQWHRQ